MRRTKKMIAVLAIVAMVLTMIPVQMFGDLTTVPTGSNIYGSTRIDTATAIADLGWKSADTVILCSANDANLVDALAASPLAGQLNAPILLSYNNALDANTKSKITALGATKVLAIGALSDAVVQDLQGMGLSVEVLKGSNRLETTKMINSKLTDVNGTFVVGFNGLPDAMSAGSYAAANGYAIIIADGAGNVPSDQSTLGGKTYILGGPTLVKDIANAERIYGTNRFETNQRFIQTFADSFSYNYVFVANGTNAHLVDALPIAPYAAQDKALIALTDGSSVAAASAIKDKVTDATKVFGVGGPSVVSSSVLAQVGQAGSGTDATGALDVTSVRILNLKQIEVVFNKAVNKTFAEKAGNYSITGPGLGGFSLVGTATTENPYTSDAKLQEDGKTVIVTLDHSVDPGSTRETTKFENNEEYNVTISNVRDTAGNRMQSVTFREILARDNTLPTFESVNVLGPKVLDLIFSEPISNIDSKRNSYLTSSNISIENGKYGVSSAQARPHAKAIRVVLSSELKEGSYSIRVKNLEDYAGYAMAQTDQTFSLTPVTEAPTYTVKSAEPDKVVLLFNRPVRKVDNYDNEIKLGYTKLDSTNSTITPKGKFQVDGVDYASEWEIKLKTESIVLNGSTVNVSVANKGSSNSSKIADLWGNLFVASSMTADVEGDNAKPEVLGVRVKDDSTIYVQFSKDMNKDEAVDRYKYTLYDADGKLYKSKSGITDSDAHPYVNGTYDDSAYETKFVFAEPLESQEYTLKVSAIKDANAYNNQKTDTTSVSFNIADESGLELVSAYAATSGSNIDRVTLTFNKNVMEDRSATGSAKVPGNYKIGNVTVDENATINVNGRTVTITGTKAGTPLVGKTIYASICDVNGNMIKANANAALIQNTQIPTTNVDSMLSNFKLVNDGSDDLKLTFDTNVVVSSLDRVGIMINGVVVRSASYSDSNSGKGSTVTFGIHKDSKIATYVTDNKLVADGNVLANIFTANDGAIKFINDITFNGAIAVSNAGNTGSGNLKVEDLAPPKPVELGSKVVAPLYDGTNAIRYIEVEYSEGIYTMDQTDSRAFEVDGMTVKKVTYTQNGKTILIEVNDDGKDIAGKTFTVPKIKQLCNVRDSAGNWTDSTLEWAKHSAVGPSVDPTPAAGAAISTAATVDVVTDTTIKVNAATLASSNPGGQVIEYAISSSNTTAPTDKWQAGLEFTELTPETTYYVWARSQAKTGYNAGTAVASAAITTAATPDPETPEE